MSDIDAGQAQLLVDYVKSVVLRDPSLDLTPESPLVSSGLIDSFALVDLLLKVEEVTAMRIPAAKVQPKDMDTVAKMLDTAARLGRPRTR